MRTPAIFALLCVAATTTPHRVESHGLGGLIKKKAAEAANPVAMRLFTLSEAPC